MSQMSAHTRQQTTEGQVRPHPGHFVSNVQHCTTFIFRDPAAGKHEKNTVLKEMDTKSTPAIIDASRRWVSQEDMQLTKEEALICVERLGGYVEQMSEKIKPTELINALQDAIDVLTQRSASKGSALMVTHKGLMPIYKGPAIKTLRRGHHSRSRCLSHPGRRTQTLHATARCGERTQGFVVERFGSRSERFWQSTDHYQAPFQVSIQHSLWTNETHRCGCAGFTRAGA